MSNSVWPHRQQPTRLPCPWDSPGKNTGVGCHFLLQCMKVKSQSEKSKWSHSVVSNSSLPHGLQPTSLLHPWDFSGKSTGAGAIAFSDTFPTVDEFNSDDHYVYYYGQESLRRNGVAIIVSKKALNAVLWCNLKSDRMISVHLQGKSFNITVIQVYASTSNAEEAEVEWFYEDL